MLVDVESTKKRRERKNRPLVSSLRFLFIFFLVSTFSSPLFLAASVSFVLFFCSVYFFF